MAFDFNDYSIIATGGGEKLERWGGVVLLRPDPQVIWPAAFDLKKYPGLHARYARSAADGGGAWETLKPFPREWVIEWREHSGASPLKFKIKPMGFKHTGLFPEQAQNWRRIIKSIRRAQLTKPNVLNLFAYTGGATVAALSAGANVCHVDASKGMTERAGENAKISGVYGPALRLIIDDCGKFVAREIRRGKKYDGIIMDPPSFGRGPGGETWKLEDGLFDLVSTSAKLLSDDPLFFLINSYTTGLSASVMENILRIALKARGGKFDGYELILPTEEKGIVLPCGNSCMWSNE